jgi:hypothetical protein
MKKKPQQQQQSYATISNEVAEILVLSVLQLARPQVMP